MCASFLPLCPGKDTSGAHRETPSAADARTHGYLGDACPAAALFRRAFPSKNSAIKSTWIRGLGGADGRGEEGVGECVCGGVQLALRDGEG